ncbi:MAG: hypothetical protein M1812_000729 [Candelaria pacifica]|nr:MAG: hypothetical protein M1812_000729 [Candelaria pacifica]
MKGPPASRPTVLTDILPTELIEYILQHHAAPTTLVVCSSRETFLHQLLTLIQQTRPSSPPQPAEDSPSNIPPRPKKTHRFLTPTIHLLSVSRTINIAFCPTLQHLRAYLTVYQAPAPLPSPSLNKPGPNAPIFALLNAIALHRSTPDHSAQGLSRTFAAAVEAAAREKMILIVAECGKAGDDNNLESEPWEEQVHLLNGTLRGLGTEGRGWAGRTVRIRRVLERWCMFRRYEVDGDDNADDGGNDEEMTDLEAVNEEQNADMLGI